MQLSFAVAEWPSKSLEEVIGKGGVEEVVLEKELGRMACKSLRTWRLLRGDFPILGQ